MKIKLQAKKKCWVDYLVVTHLEPLTNLFTNHPQTNGYELRHFKKGTGIIIQRKNHPVCVEFQKEGAHPRQTDLKWGFIP